MLIKKLPLQQYLISGFLSVLMLFGISTYALANNNDESYQATMNSLQVIKDTLEGLPNCLHYRVIGICIWRQCDWYGCWLEPTPELDHYLPDAVVTVYNKKGDNPWLYANKVVDPAAYIAAKKAIHYKTGIDIGSGQESENSSKDISDHFKEVDIIGNPALAILSAHTDILLASQATPYVPYYSSLLDAYFWRFPSLAERLLPGSHIPGLHDVGTIVLHDWGPIYPRTGFIDQPNDAKAAAVLAMRAGHIITREGQPHVYHNLSNSCGDHCNSYPVTENNNQTQWQMIYPTVKNACIDFGGSDALSPTPWNSEASQKGHGNYAWVLWREYHGCVQDDGAHFIRAISF